MAAKPVPTTGVVIAPPPTESVQPAQVNGSNNELIRATAVGDTGAVAELTGNANPSSAPLASPPPSQSLEISTGSGKSTTVNEMDGKPVTVSIDSRQSPSGSPELRLVNTKRFSLSYAVEDNGTGLAAVDLWETRDCKTWKKCDHATQLSHAYVVEVAEDGMYGYTMVARGAADKRETQPKAGDVPQVWVTVDATKPVVQLTGVELNLTSRLPNLIIRWSAQDRNFGPRPVTLSYAEQMEGPWVTLAANIENTSRYECPIPTTMPKKAFIRVEAVDLVGNSGVAVTVQTVRLDFAPTPPGSLLPPPPMTPPEAIRPAVHIQAVKSVAGDHDQ
jgi:hypothetical protein